ncbi:MAG: flagellar brake protein [Myxococcales bacterium]|nr:flagellar brake protein [Myxococcales bacterium]
MNDRGRTRVPTETVAALLRDACAAGARLALRLEGTPPKDGAGCDAARTHSSTLLEVRSDGGLVIAPPASADARRRLAELSRVAVECTHGGVKHDFWTRRVGEVLRPEGPALLLAPPEDFCRLQRRQYFRVGAPDGSQAVVASASGLAGVRRLIDLGGGGVSVQLATDDELPADTAITRVEVRLPGEEPFVTSGQVRHLDGSTTSDGGRRCGIEFGELAMRERERLIRYAIRRERELLGRRQSPRIAADGALVTLAQGDGPARRRQVLNLSSGGALLQLESPRDHDLVRGVILHAVELRVPGAETITTEAVVVRIESAGGHLTCGLEFQGLSRDAREMLAHYARLGSWGPSPAAHRSV